MEASELNSILEQHRLWIDGKGGKRANLCGADLRDANLTDANLMGADLYRAILMGADLRGSSLTGADLRGSSLMGANLTGADLRGSSLMGADLEDADLICADLEGANLRGANFTGADLTNTILPDISWIIPGCLVQLNQIKYSFPLYKEVKYDNFIQDSFGFFIQNNEEEGTFDMLLGDRIIRGIPDWVKYTGLRQIATESV